MIAYIDESGDLGWTLDKPYHNGGSSRYLTISFLLTRNSDNKYPKRILKKLHERFHLSANTEIKGLHLTDEQRSFFVEKTIGMLSTHPDISILSITVSKINVAAHIRQDGNKLYNYMAGLTLLEEISREDEVTLVPDPRTIKVRSANSFLDYLQSKLWFDHSVSTRLKLQNLTSDQCINLQFIDIVSNILWNKYENQRAKFADCLSPHIKCKELFFDEHNPA